MLVFEERGKPEYPEKNLALGARKRTNKKTRPTNDAGSGNRTRDTLLEDERSDHCAIPASVLLHERGQGTTASTTSCNIHKETIPKQFS